MSTVSPGWAWTSSKEKLALWANAVPATSNADKTTLTEINLSFFKYITITLYALEIYILLIFSYCQNASQITYIYLSIFITVRLTSGKSITLSLVQHLCQTTNVDNLIPILTPNQETPRALAAP